MGADTQLSSSLIVKMMYKPVLLVNTGSAYVTALMLVLQQKAVSTLPLSLWPREKLVPAKAVSKCGRSALPSVRVHLLVSVIFSLTMRFGAGLPTLLASALSLSSSHRKGWILPPHSVRSLYRTSLCELELTCPCGAVNGIWDPVHSMSGNLSWNCFDLFMG